MPFPDSKKNVPAAFFEKKGTRGGGAGGTQK